jgi:hypothetical protein
MGNAEWQLPDYLNDLNAMHEAEKVLMPNQLTEYGSALMFCERREFAGIRATAAQRAEAFLKTINKWEAK